VWSLSDGGASSCAVLRHSASGPKGKSVTRDVASLDWSRDGARLATGCYDGRGRIWSSLAGGGDGALQHVLTGHTQPVLSVQWSPDGASLLTGSVDKTAIVWDAASGAITQQFAFHTAPVLDVDWASDEQFAVCSSDKTITLCSTQARAPLRTFAGHKDEVNAIHWSPAKAVLASASDDMTAKLWSPAADKDAGAAATLAGHKKAVYSVKWAPTGEGSANAGKDASLATCVRRRRGARAARRAAAARHPRP
jgi:transducin (beta)-like 1